MNPSEISGTDAENIQAILEYIHQNGVIHKAQLPASLERIAPEQYEAYQQVIFAIEPEVVENVQHSDNMGIPATDHLEPYMKKGGFLGYYNAHILKQQQEETDRELSRALQQLQIEASRQQVTAGKEAIAAARKAGHRATIAVILAAVALLLALAGLVK